MKKLLIPGLAVLLSLLFFCMWRGREILLIRVDAQEQEAQKKPPAEPSEEGAGKEGKQQELSPLEKAIRDLAASSPQAREFAMRELAKMGKEAVPQLSKILGVVEDDELEGVDPELKEKIEKLLSGLDSEDWATRQAASKELAQIGELAEPFLRRTVRNGTPETKTGAEKLLELLAKKRRGGKSKEEYEKDQYFRRLGALRVLGEIGGPSINPGLLAALSDKGLLVRLGALQRLRRNFGWSFGFSVDDVVKHTDRTVNYWSEFLKDPRRPSGEEKWELKTKYKEGETLEISARWDLLTATISRVMTVYSTTDKDGKRKIVREPRTNTNITEHSFRQSFSDTLAKAGPGVVKLTRTYTVHTAGRAGYRREGWEPLGGFGDVGQKGTRLQGCELEFAMRPGCTDVKVLKGKLTLWEKECLPDATFSFSTFSALLPGRPVQIGESWEPSELGALRLLHSLGPAGLTMFAVDSVKMKCTLNAVTQGDEGKKAHVSILTDVGPDTNSDRNIAGNWGSSPSSYYGRIPSLAGITLTGDCILDLDTGKIESLHLFGAFFQAVSSGRGLVRRGSDTSACGILRIEVSISHKTK